MGRSTHCGCSICDIESCIRSELGAPDNHRVYLEIVGENPVFTGFPSAFHLLATVHGSRDVQDGAAFSDLIFAQLLQSRSSVNHWPYIEKLLILFFIPSVHSAVRHVSHHYPFLAREDLSQYALISLLQYLRSSAWQSRRSHFGFVVAQELRRSLFRWARREFESTSQFAAQKLRERLSVAQTAEESFERHAILRHFLRFCEQHAYLMPEELNLLIDIKIDQSIEACASGANGRISNSCRQKLKRLMKKLRRIAQRPGSDQEKRAMARVCRVSASAKRLPGPDKKSKKTVSSRDTFSKSRAN